MASSITDWTMYILWRKAHLTDQPHRTLLICSTNITSSAEYWSRTYINIIHSNALASTVTAEVATTDCYQWGTTWHGGHANPLIPDKHGNHSHTTTPRDGSDICGLCDICGLSTCWCSRHSTSDTSATNNHLAVPRTWLSLSECAGVLSLHVCGTV